MNADKKEKERYLRWLRRSALEGGLAERQMLEAALSYGAPKADAVVLAGELCRHFGSLRGVMRAAPEALAQVEGMSDNAALLFQLFTSLSCNRMARRMEGILDTPEKWADYLWPYFSRQRQERFYVLGLNMRGQMKCCELLGQGGDTFVDLDIKRICAIAMRSQAERVVLAHNHPGGVATPSQNDILFTRACRKALESLKIQLLDHLVFTDEECVSFADSRMLD